MSTLKAATKDERRRLLELFPVALLRKEFGDTGTKDGIADQVADDKSDEQIDKVLKFVSAYLGCCKQHVYVFPEDGALPTEILNVAVEVESAEGKLFLGKETYTVFAQNPLRVETISYFWPIKVEKVGGNVVVRFVVLEKSISTLFGESAKLADKLLTEEGILESWRLEDGLRVDLNKGVKSLWESDWMDCIRGRYKKPYSMSIEAMDVKQSIKKKYPKIYAEMLTSPIHTSAFTISDDAIKLGMFATNPTEGTISFPTYSIPGDSDAIIRKIIENNQ